MRREANEHEESPRRVHEGAANRAVVWIDDGSGRIVDELAVETRIRPGTEGCQLCHEALDGREPHGAVEFHERGLPRLLLGPGRPICIDCREWVRWLHYYAEIGPVSKPRFTEGGLVLRAGTDELYRVVEARLTGLPASGIWFPVYTCQRIEVGESTGEILPACLGLEFELADFELQPVPPRYPIAASGGLQIDRRHPAVDLVGARSTVPMLECPPPKDPEPRIEMETRRLLPGKGGSP